MSVLCKQVKKEETEMNVKHTETPHLFTLVKFAEKHANFTTLSAITNQVFKAQPRYSSNGEISGNGMLDYGVIVRCGRRVLINEEAYFNWLGAQQKGSEN